MSWDFEDCANGLMLLAGIAMVTINVVEAESARRDRLDDIAADRFVAETKARMNAMHDHIMQKRGSKEAYVEAFTAAKNVIRFEVADKLEGNPYSVSANNRIELFIDTLIAKAK